MFGAPSAKNSHERVADRTKLNDAQSCLHHLINMLVICFSYVIRKYLVRFATQTDGMRCPETQKQIS